MHKDASSLRHIQLLSIFFMTVGAWPTEFFDARSRRKINTIFIIVVSCINMPGEFYYLWKMSHVLTFMDLGEIYLTLFLSLLVWVLTVLPLFKGYGTIVKEFVMEFHLFYFKHKGDHYEKIYATINKLSHYFTIVTLSYTIIGTIFFNLAPLYNNYRNGVFSDHKDEDYRIQFAIYFLQPWFNPEDRIIATSFINLYMSYYCAILVCGMDLLMSLMAFQIIGHIKTLIYDLRNIPRPKKPVILEYTCVKTKTKTDLCVEVYDAHENKNIHRKLVECVIHHRFIVSFADSVSQFFGPLLALTYLYHLVSCALLLLECSQGELAAIGKFGPLTAIIFYQLIQISVTFEVVGSESEKLKLEVYDIPWECMSVSNQKLVWIFLSRVQIPIRITGLGMVEVGVNAMASILKTTFSYFALLRTMGESL